MKKTSLQRVEFDNIVTNLVGKGMLKLKRENANMSYPVSSQSRDTALALQSQKNDEKNLKKQ